MRAPNTETSTAAVGVSVSESPDLWALGLSDGHLRDAMAEIALHVLGSGRSLAYGEDLRQHGFMEFLAELTGRYRNHPRHGGTIVVTDYLAWPVHIRMTSDELAAFRRTRARRPPRLPRAGRGMPCAGATDEDARA